VLPFGVLTEFSQEVNGYLLEQLLWFFLHSAISGGEGDFFSFLHDGAENYPIIEKECLAIVWGIHRFEQYLYGREFTIQTDHSPLRYLDSMKSTSGRLTRWALQLQPFNYAVQVIPGKDNLGADFLSRIQDE
jgi:hypothetical protein